MHAEQLPRACRADFVGTLYGKTPGKMPAKELLDPLGRPAPTEKVDHPILQAVLEEAVRKVGRLALKGDGAVEPTESLLGKREGVEGIHPAASSRSDGALGEPAGQLWDPADPAAGQ